MPGREPLPHRRTTWTHKVRLGGWQVYLSVGEYPDGRPGEIFINTSLSRCDADARALLNCFAIMVSVALQYGVPLEIMVGQFVGSRFDLGQGVVVGSERLRLATSVLDWVFRELAIHYLGAEDLAHTPPIPADDEPGPAESKG